MVSNPKQIQVYTVVDGKCESYRTVFDEVIVRDGSYYVEINGQWVQARRRDDGVYVVEEYKYTSVNSIIDNFLKDTFNV